MDSLTGSFNKHLLSPVQGRQKHTQIASARGPASTILDTPRGKPHELGPWIPAYRGAAHPRNVSPRECIPQRFLHEEHPTTQWLRTTIYWAPEAVSGHSGPHSAGQDFRRWLGSLGHLRWVAGGQVASSWGWAGRWLGRQGQLDAAGQPRLLTAVSGSESGERAAGKPFSGSRLP